MKLYSIFFCIICIYLPTVNIRAQTDKELETYVSHQDSLMHLAYTQKDVNSYEQLLDNFQSKFNKMTQGDKAMYNDAYANALYKLCCVYSLLNKKDKALEYFKKTIKAGYSNSTFRSDDDLNNIRNEPGFKQLNEPLIILDDLTDKYNIAIEKGILDSIVFFKQQAALVIIKNKNIFPDWLEVEFQSDLAYALWWVGNYPDALETYFKALERAEALNDTISISSIYNGIAAVYRNEGNYRQAINYYSKAEDITKQWPDNYILYSAMIDKGKAYEQLDILDSAYSYLQDWLAMKYRKYKGQKDMGAGGGEAEMGIIYSKMGKKQLADDFFRQSFQLNKDVKELRLLARGYNEYAEHFARYHQQDSAIYYATEGFLLDKQNNFLVQQLAASTLLSKLYTQENQIDSAFKYQQAMITLKDSVFSSEKISRLQTLGFNEQLRQRERVMERIEAENKRYENIQYALIAIGLVTFIILFLLLSRRMITSPKLIRFLGVVSLLLVFEFLNLVLHPYLEEMTHHSPVLMLISLVCIAALLVPLHHRLEHLATEKLVDKNKKIRLALAKKTIEKLEGNVS